jgi:transcription initiation factor TFIIB
MICGNCGLVMGTRIIDTRSEWRTFANDEGGADPSRIGAVSDPLLGGHALANTVIGGLDGGSGAANEYARVHGKVTNASKENTMIKAFKEIETMCQRIGLNKLVCVCFDIVGPG